MRHAELTFAANLTLLFTEHPLLERPARAAACGFEAAELWWPFDTPVPDDHAVDELLAAFDDAGVALVGLNFDAGDMAGGDRGLVSLPTEAQRFRANVDVVVGIAERTGCRVLNALYGNRVDEAAPEQQDELAVEQLSRAARAAGDVGATVVVEALNSFESPRYPLTRTAHALAVIDRVTATGAPAPGLLYDAYHMQRMEGNLIATIREHAERIAHVQIADSPWRSEPGTGEIAYQRVLPELSGAGYRGYVALEYKPTTESDQSVRLALREATRSPEDHDREASA